MLQEGLFEEGLFADSRRARWPSPPCQRVRVDFRACRMHYFCCKRSHQRLYCSAPFWRPFLCLFSPGRPFAGVAGVGEDGRLRLRHRQAEAAGRARELILLCGRVGDDWHQHRWSVYSVRASRDQTTTGAHQTLPAASCQ